MTTLVERAATDTAPTTSDSTPRILNPAETYARTAATRREIIPFIEFTRQRWHLLTSAGMKDEHLKGILSEVLFILPNSLGHKATIEQLAAQMSYLRWLIQLCELSNGTERSKAAQDESYRPRYCPIPSADALQWLANMAS